MGRRCFIGSPDVTPPPDEVVLLELRAALLREDYAWALDVVERLVTWLSAPGRVDVVLLVDDEVSDLERLVRVFGALSGRIDELFFASRGWERRRKTDPSMTWGVYLASLVPERLPSGIDL